MIRLYAIPTHTNNLIIDGHDYNCETPQDELQHHIEQNIDFIETEEQELKSIIKNEPSF